MRTLQWFDVLSDLFLLNVLQIISFTLNLVPTLQVEDVCHNGGEQLDGNYPKCSCQSGYKGCDCSQIGDSC